MDDHPAGRIDAEFPDESDQDTARRAHVSCRADMSVKLTLLMDPGTKYAQIGWDVSEDYPTSMPLGTDGLTVALYAGDKSLANSPCPTRTGTFLTEIPFVVGLHARIFDWDCQSKGRLLMAKTDTTTSPTEPVSGEAHMSVEIVLQEYPAPPTENTQVGYEISDNYPRSKYDDGICGPKVALYIDDEKLAEDALGGRKGNWYPIEQFRKGLNARVYDWDWMGKKILLLCQTDPVP
jgi:hypothetical protein